MGVDSSSRTREPEGPAAASRTGAVKVPSRISEPAGLPIVSSSATRSRASSAIWKTMPTCQAHSESASTTESGASAAIAPRRADVRIREAVLALITRLCSSMSWSRLPTS